MKNEKLEIVLMRMAGYSYASFHDTLSFRCTGRGARHFAGGGGGLQYGVIQSEPNFVYSRCLLR
jgi:hypothetical protein